MSNINKLLGLNGMTTAPFFHDNSPENTEFRYPGYHKSQFIARGETTVFPDTTSTARNSVRFEIHQESHFIGAFNFAGVFEATTGTPAVPGVTNNRLINWAPREQIDYVEIKAGKSAKKPVRIPGRLLHFEHYATTVMHELEGIKHLELGMMSDLERTAAFTADQPWEVSIKTPWDELNAHIPLSALQDDLIIEIFFKPDSAILCYNGILPNPIVRTNMSLTFEQYMFFKQDYQYNIQDMFTSEGIEYYKRDVDYSDRTITVNDLKNGKYEIPLRDFNNEVAAFYVTLRFEDHVLVDGDPALGEGNFGYDVLEDWVSHEVRDGNMIVIEPVPHDHQVWRLNTNNIMYPAGLNAIIHLNSHAIIDRSHVYGSWNPAGLSQGIFAITLTPSMIAAITAGRNVICEFTMIVHNKVSLISRTGNSENPRGTVIELFTIN